MAMRLVRTLNTRLIQEIVLILNSTFLKETTKNVQIFWLVLYKLKFPVYMKTKFVSAFMVLILFAFLFHFTALHMYLLL
jgi:hypothetical protein